jgi:hypothetical protein
MLMSGGARHCPRTVSNASSSTSHADLDVKAERYPLSGASRRRVCFDCRNVSHAAARGGDIPTIRIGGRWKVPAAALRRQLGLDTPNAA